MSEKTEKSSKNQVSIGTRIALMFGVATLVVMTILVVIVINMTGAALSATTNLYASEIVKARADELSATLSQYARFALELASRDVVKRGNFDEIFRILADRKQDTGTYVLGTFYANDNGDYITDEGDLGFVGDRDYFEAVMMKGEAWAVGSPIVSRIHNVPVVVVSAPVKRNGVPDGIIGVQVALSDLSKSVAAINIDNAGFGIIVDNSGVVVAHPEAEMILEVNLVQADSMGYSGLSDVIKKMIAGESDVAQFKNQKGIAERIMYAPIADSGGWSLGLVVEEAYVLKSSVELAVLVVGIGIAAIAIIIIVSILVGRSISIPIKIAVERAAQIAGGELRHDIPVEYTRRRDEIGSLAVALQDMLGRLRTVLTEVTSASIQVSAGSNQLSGTSQQMSQGATEQASSVEEISASMEQMSSNIRQNADNALQTEKIARRSASAAAEGGKSVMDTVAAMKEIASKISIIEEIARSTNMLSLNASIEAARAGEFGKGFAVVASEVGKLAERSQRESSEISKLSLESVSIAELAGKTITDLIPEIQRTAELVQEISAASNEQNSGAEQINSAIMQLDKVVQQNAAASEESASMAEELSSQSEQLQEAIGYFKIDRATAPADQQQNQINRTNQRMATTKTVEVSVKKTVPLKESDGASKEGLAENKSVAQRVRKPVREEKNEPTDKTAKTGKMEKTDKPIKTDTRLPVSGIVLNLDDENKGPARDKLDSDYEEF